MHSRHSLFVEKKHCPIGFESDTDREISELKDWVFSFTCVAHACSRSLRWGLKSLVLGGDQFVEDIHVTVSSLLRASTGLSLAVPEFIAGFVDFDLPEPSNYADIEMLWSFLDIEPRHMHFFLKVNPIWTGQRLRVSSSLINDPECVACLKTVINCCLRFCDFSDTRWVKVGQCGRFFLKGLLIGLDKLVDLAMKNDSVCKWHLAGYHKKCNINVKTYLTTAAFASRPSESMLLDVLEDDRFLMRSERCWQIVVDEFDFLLGLPEYVWITAADVLKDIDHRILKAHVVEASLVSMAYIHLECFVPLTKPPVKYILGDCAENLQGLKNEIGVTDPVASNMQTLSLMGYDDDVLAACMLVRETSLSTTLVEQAHASGAMISNRHPQLEQAQLVSRMTVHNCRALFSAGKYEKQQLRLSTLLSQLTPR